MGNKKFIVISMLAGIMTLASSLLPAQPMPDMGQVIKVQTNLSSFIGMPSWLIIIRDLDHGQNIPYLFDITRGDDFWMAFTYSRNYLIVASELTFNPYERKIHNFCNLESMGAIMRDVSMDITISGDLTRNTNTYKCNIMKYAGERFTISSSD